MEDPKATHQQYPSLNKQPHITTEVTKAASPWCLGAPQESTMGETQVPHVLPAGQSSLAATANSGQLPLLSLRLYKARDDIHCCCHNSYPESEPSTFGLRWANLPSTEMKALVLLINNIWVLFLSNQKYLSNIESQIVWVGTDKYVLHLIVYFLCTELKKWQSVAESEK